MRALSRLRFSLALEHTETILPLEHSSVIIETGNLFKDNTLVANVLPFDKSGNSRERGRLFEDNTLAANVLPFGNPGNSSERGRLFKDDSSSALNNYALSQRHGYKPMVSQWLNEQRREGTADWLVCLMCEAGSVAYRNPKPSTKGMVDPTPQAESLPSLSDGSSCSDNKQIEEDILDVLIQKLYRSFYFKNAGGYKTCVNNPSGEGTALSKTNTSSQRSGQKRANAGVNEPTSDDDQDSKSGKVKKARTDRPNLEEFTTLFACPLCKGNIMFGYERGCRDWKNRCIDTVLRRHLATHVEIDHISQEDFDKAQVKELRKTFKFALDGKPEDLWVAAFMVLFNYPETDRHKVPSPYWSTQDNVGNIPLYPDFYANMRQRLTHDRTVPFEVTQYFRENDALAIRRRERREELVRKFKAIGQERMEQAQRQTNDEFQTAEQAMNLEFDKQATILNERYQMKWAIRGHGTPVMQNVLPSTYDSAAQQQQPPAMAMSSPPLAAQSNGISFMDDMVCFDDSPRTPSGPVNPALLGNNVEVRPSSVSPSAVEREDSNFEGSGIGICNSALPCRKDFVCDYHKPFHTVVGRGVS